MRESKLALVALVALLAGCGTRTTWEPESEAAARYGSWTDEELFLESLQRAVGEILEAHPPASVKAVAIRVPRDPDGYSAAALLADAYEKGGASVAWMPLDAAAAPRGAAEVWEVATTIRGAVTQPSGGEPPYQRVALVEVRISSLAARDGRLAWNAKGRGKAYRYVNVLFPDRRVVPDAK
jgi:hypothetical protein